MKKKGYVSIEAIIIAAITIGIALYVFWKNNENTKAIAENAKLSVVNTDSYMGGQIKDAYNSDYGGVDLDDGWNDGNNGNVGNLFPVYHLVDRISIPNNHIIINVGSEIPINLSVFPENASQSKLSWRVMSGKENVLITRDNKGHNGTLMGLKAGKTAIKVSATDGSGQSLIFYVTIGQPVTGLILDKENQTLSLSFSGNNSTTVKATVQPDETSDSPATERRVSWSFGNGGLNSECFEMTPNHKNNTVTIGLTSSSFAGYCNGKSSTIIATTEDGGFQKKFDVIARK